MKTKQWKKAAALMSAGAMTASIFAAPLAVKADDKVTISFSFDQGVGEATQKMVDAYNESQDKVEVQTVILPQDANTVHDDFVNKLASGDTSIDVMGLDVTYISEFGSAGWLADLSDLVDPSLTEGMLTGPVEGATIDVDGAILKTNASGQAVFNLKAGSYTAKIKKKGYATVTQAVTVAAAAVTENITLIPTA